MTQRNSTLAPRLLGYAFEGAPRRVIGFVFEEVIGRRPSIADLKTCEIALRQLHDLDIIHGDINEDNMFIAKEGVKFIDFEDASIGFAGNPGTLEQA